jgi:hypothetical protein
MRNPKLEVAMAIPWHRIFGMALTQYFAGTAWQVDVEVEGAKGDIVNNRSEQLSCC